jgi:hypothetical protein
MGAESNPLPSHSRTRSGDTVDSRRAVPVEPAGEPAVEHDPEGSRPRRSHSCAGADRRGTAPTEVVTDVRAALPSAASAAIVLPPTLPEV